MKIGIDFDGVLNNMLETWVKWLNKNYDGYQVKPEEITEWTLSTHYPELTEAELFAPLGCAEFWAEVPIRYEAPEVVERLLAEGHELYIITSSYYTTLRCKLEKCLFTHFPYLTEQNIIVTYDKSLIRVDLLIDDAEHNLKNFFGIRVIFDTPYNKTCSCADYRVASWKEFYVLVSELSASRPRKPYSRIKQFKAGRGLGKTAWLHQMIYDSTHQVSAVTEVPCYLIANNEYEYNRFCRSYRERFGEVCPVKLYEFNQPLEDDARIFVDMPSTLPVKSKAFAAFRNIFVSRDNIFCIADFENTYWHSVY